MSFAVNLVISLQKALIKQRIPLHRVPQEKMVPLQYKENHGWKKGKHFTGQLVLIYLTVLIFHSCHRFHTACVTLCDKCVLVKLILLVTAASTEIPPYSSQSYAKSKKLPMSDNVKH